jgi:hypothetical protein
LLAVLSPVLARTAIVAAQATPNPAPCTAEPRTIDEIATLAATPAGEPAAFDKATAVPIDELTGTEIIATTSAAIYCSNTNDPLGALAYFTDRYVSERFGSEHPDDLASLIAAASRPPVWADKEDRLEVSATVGGLIDPATNTISMEVDTYNGATQFRDLLYFVNVDNHWLIDSWESIAMTPGTPVAAS